ncbi:uncharacterized protein LOC118428423 isoform X2 [Branchiostoma floridae]|uniref:Uncharacterized protein LOC118428423 isoform X2 n=1 Tax=Branchiostoma floridae TaxID=7739 RepID=A0A9J7N936_BRAFL|nr:uncharacterized protein LOC118428423 isoform X2 [Branchiostoma floridae]
MQKRVVKSEPHSGWGAVSQSCPGCVAVNLVSQGTLGPNTVVPPHLPGCPSQNATDDDDVIFVGTPANDPLQPAEAGNPQGRTMLSDEDDLLVTFVSLPETAHYPHARGDCKIHSFKQIGIQKLGKSWGYGKWKSLQSREVDLTTIGPVESNAKYCEKCYCFMCDVPANQCQQWTNPAGAHCNAYKCPSWLAQQTSKPSPLLSRLTVELMTQEVRDAVRRTDELVRGIQEEYVTFRKGKPCLCTCHQLVAGTSWCEVCKAHHQVEQYDYSLVREKLLDAVKEAKAESHMGRGDAGMVMLDSLVHVLVLEKSPPNSRPNRNVGYKVWETKFYQSRNEIMKEIDELLMDIFVLVKTTPALRKSVVANLTEMLNREGVRHPWALSIRQWEDRLLSLVLTGANLTGRKGNDVLLEHCMVIKRRVERLKMDGNYRQAVRYLKCVNIPAHNLAGLSLSQERAEFLQLQQQVPLLYTRCGAFSEAFMALASGPVDARHISDSIIAKMDGATFLDLMKSLSTNLCGVKGLPAHKILWACLVALTMNVGVQLNLEFLIWFVRWAANSTTGSETPSHDEAACNRARALIQASQKGLLTVSALKESEVLSKLIVTASEAVLYPLFAHRHDAYLDRVAAAFGSKLWAFECSLNSCTLSSVFASTHLAQWLRKKYIPVYGVLRLRDTTWSNILVSAPQPVAAVLIEEMLNATPIVYPTIFACLRFFTSKLVSAPQVKIDTRLLAAFANQVFPMAKAANKTTLVSNIVKLSFFNDPNEASVLALRELYAKEWPKVLDSMIRLLPAEKMEVALVSCFTTCVKKGEVDIVVRMLHANRAGHPSTKTAYDFVPTVPILVEKLADQLTELEKDTAIQMCDSIKDWLRDESYSPLLCQNCNYDIPLISLNEIWKAVGSLCPDRLEHILAHAMKRLGKALTTFHMVKQSQRVSIVSWLKRVAAVMKKFGKNLEYQVHLSFLTSAISTKRGLVKEIQSCPELAADIIPTWLLQEWEGTYSRSMSKWSVKSSGPTKLTFKKTVSPGPVSPVSANVYSSKGADKQGAASQLSDAPAAVFKAGVDNIMSMQPSLKESNNNIRPPGNGVKDMNSMSLEEILQYNCPPQSKSVVNGEAVHPATSKGGSPGSIQVPNQPLDARYARQGTPNSAMAVNGMVQPSHFNPGSNCASQALHMVASRMHRSITSTQSSPLESQLMATTSVAVPPQRPISGIETNGSSTIVSSAGSQQALLRPPPPPLVSDLSNRAPADQVPLLPPHSRPPPNYQGYLRSMQNSNVTTQPLPVQSSGSQSMGSSGRVLDRMVNFVNSLGSSSTPGQPIPHMTPYQLTQPAGYPIDLQHLSAGQILPQFPMQPTGSSSSAATNVPQSLAVQSGGQVTAQQCSTTAVLNVRPTVQHQPLHDIQSQMAASARTHTPELTPAQFQPTSSSAVGLSIPLFQNSPMSVTMPVSNAQLLRFPTTSEPVHVFIPNVHQNLGNGVAVPMSVVHHHPSPQPLVVSSQQLQAIHPVSISSSLHSIAGQGVEGVPLSTGDTLGAVGQQTGSHTALNADALQQQMQAAVSAQDKGPVPVHVTFVPPPVRQDEETESDDEYTFDTTMPSPPRSLEMDEIVLISDSEEDQISDSKLDDDCHNKEVQRQDDLPEMDPSSSTEQSLATENSQTDTEPKDAQETSDVEPLLNMSCESIDSDVDERRTVPRLGKKAASENVVTTSLNVQENTSLSERSHQANLSSGESRVEVQNTLPSERSHQATLNSEENGLEVQNSPLSERSHQASVTSEENEVEVQNTRLSESSHQTTLSSDESREEVQNTSSSERSYQSSTNSNESNESHDHKETEHTQDEEETVVLENNASFEPDPDNTNFWESKKSQEENEHTETEHMQVEEDTVVLENNTSPEPDPDNTNFWESKKGQEENEHNETEHMQVEGDTVVLEKNTSPEPDPGNTNFGESSKSHEENGAERIQDNREAVVPQSNASTAQDQFEVEPDEGSSIVANSNNTAGVDDVVSNANDKKEVVLQLNAVTEPEQSEIEPAEGSSMLANSDITAGVDYVNDTTDISDDNCFEQASLDKGTANQTLEDDSTSVQKLSTTQDNNPANPDSVDMPTENYDVQQTDEKESSGIEKASSANADSQLDTQTMVKIRTTEQQALTVREYPSKETGIQISTAVAGVVARLVIDVVKAAETFTDTVEESSSSTCTQMTTTNVSDAHLSRPSAEDICSNAQTSSSTEIATNRKDSRTGKKRKAEALVNDVVKKTKKMPNEESDSKEATACDYEKISKDATACDDEKRNSKEATGNSTKRNSGNAKENRKIAQEKGPKDVRPKKLHNVERRNKLTRAISEQISTRANAGKNGKMLNSTGKTVDPVKKRSGKVRVDDSHTRSARKDRESVRKDGLVSLKIMTVDATAQARVTVQELQTAKCNVTFEQRKSNKTAKEKPNCRSMGPRAKMLRSNSCDNTAKERNTLHRWLGRSTKGKSSDPSKPAVTGKTLDTYQNVLVKKRILNRSRIPHGVKLPRGLKLKKFPVVRLERIDTDHHTRKLRLRRSRSQPT